MSEKDNCPEKKGVRKRNVYGKKGVRKRNVSVR